MMNQGVKSNICEANRPKVILAAILKRFWKEKFDMTHLGRAPIVLLFPHYLTPHCQKTEDETGGSKEGVPSMAQLTKEEKFMSENN